MGGCCCVCWGLVAAAYEVDYFYGVVFLELGGGDVLGGE